MMPAGVQASSPSRASITGYGSDPVNPCRTSQQLYDRLLLYGGYKYYGLNLGVYLLHIAREVLWFELLPLTLMQKFENTTMF